MYVLTSLAGGFIIQEAESSRAGTGEDGGGHVGETDVRATLPHTVTAMVK